MRMTPQAAVLNALNHPKMYNNIAKFKRFGFAIAGKRFAATVLIGQSIHSRFLKENRSVFH